MKKSTFLAIISLFALLTVFNSKLTAQQRFGESQRNKQTAARTTGGDKCGTMDWLEKAFQVSPAFRIQYAENERRLAEAINRKIAEQQNNPSARTNAIITIPVVFHVVLSAGNQAAITDAMVLAQLDTLNHDFSGLNGDSTNIPAQFQAVRGHSNLRFCLAQRTPNDLPTNGIHRVVSSTVSNSSVTNDPVKSTAAGGADAWDPTRYLNIWLTNFSDPTLLGYATFPIGTSEGTGIPLSQQGVVVLAQTIPGGTAAPYNKGRTLTHEAGHFFWLRHIWGDGSGCANDFPGTPGIDDTPTQADPTFGCPGGAVAPGCGSPNPPGRMYQNFMDYTDDACMTMFTIGQGIRAETAINNFRAGLLTSNGCTTPPPAAGNDASISAILNPANSSTIACTSVTPVVTLLNLGSNTLTSATINVRLNGTQVATQAWTGSLAQGGTANITLASLNLPSLGTNTIQVHTTLPNGAIDAVPANDTSTTVVTRVAPATIPLAHNFETVFLPSGWSVNNPDGDVTWGWYGPGAGGTGAATAIDNYNFDLPGFIDDVRTTVINTTGLLANDSLLVTFDLAHKNYPGQNDVLQVLVSTDCGATFTNIWQKSGAALATAGSTTGFYTTPVASDWVKQRAAIGQNLFGGGQILVVFRNINDFGNVVWLDNINIVVKPRKDMQALTMVRPSLTECAPPFAPSLTVRNNGGEVVTGFKTGYILDGGAPVIQSHNISLATGATATVTFPNLNPSAGIHTFRMFVADPLTSEPGPDGTPANDTTSTRTFVVPVTTTNIVQGFEGTAFAPASWSIINPNNNVTWLRTTPGKASSYSAFIDNYNNNTVGQLDLLQTAPVNTTGADSVTITFDVAHKYYDDGSFAAADRLRVLASTNCGSTFTSIYSKSGPTLATAGSSADDYRTPTDSEWRTETIGLNSAFTGGNLIIQFENRNDWGNNIFLDNINITPVFKRDIEVTAVTPEVVCATAYTPTATVRNRGTETVTAFTIAYVIGTGTPIVQNVTGINLAPNTTTTVTLGAGTLAVGPNNVRIYTYAPVTASGTGDQYLVNDTLARTRYSVSTVAAPLVEGFEGSTFIPTGWAISNADVSNTWAKASTGFNSNGSAFMRNFGYLSNGQRDAMYSPVLSFTGVDSVKLTFDLSAATKVAATGSVPMDTLEVLVTKDCGNTFTSVYKKWGTALQTIYDNTPVPTEYAPNAYYLWRKETIDLTSFAPDGPLQVVFRNSTNNQNNVFVDNVNLTTRTLPARLRSEGFIVTPSPFTEQFNLWYVQAPSDLRYVTVYNSAGQLVWNRVFGSGSASNVITVDLTGKSAGFYIVNLGYSDKSKDQQIRIMKSN